MPSKGHDREKGAKGSTHKPMKHNIYSGEREDKEKLEHGPETPEVSPGGPPHGPDEERKQRY